MITFDEAEDAACEVEEAIKLRLCSLDIEQLVEVGEAMGLESEDFKLLQAYNLQVDNSE